MWAIPIALMTAGGTLVALFDVSQRWEHIGLVAVGAGLIGVLLVPLERRCTSLESAYLAGFAAGERKGRMVARPVVVPFRRTDG